MSVNNPVKEYLASIGRKGGLKSRRSLDGETARRMVQVREARRAFRRFHSQCFWSFNPDYLVRTNDLPWVADQLMKYGGREGWELGGRLCR